MLCFSDLPTRPGSQLVHMRGMPFSADKEDVENFFAELDEQPSIYLFISFCRCPKKMVWSSDRFLVFVPHTLSACLARERKTQERNFLGLQLKILPKVPHLHLLESVTDFCNCLGCFLKMASSFKGKKQLL